MLKYVKNLQIKILEILTKFWEIFRVSTPHPIFYFLKIGKSKATPKTPKPRKCRNRVFRFWGYGRYPKNEITQVPKIRQNRKNPKKR